MDQESGCERPQTSEGGDKLQPSKNWPQQNVKKCPPAGQNSSQIFLEGKGSSVKFSFPAGLRDTAEEQQVTFGNLSEAGGVWRPRRFHPILPVHCAEFVSYQ